MSLAPAAQPDLAAPTPEAAPRPPGEPPAPSAPRALGLDAVRGLAVMGMLLSGRIPIGKLPGWMSHHYHVPQGDGTFKQILLQPGFTWVDWVFPAFLFSMGAAFPFALSSRLRKGWPAWKITGGLALRFFSLVFFAIVVWHAHPWRITGQPYWVACGAALTAFALLFAVYLRTPDHWPKAAHIGVRAGGLLGLLGLLLALDYKVGDKVFALESMPAGEFLAGLTDLAQRDIIIMILAQVSVVGALIWWVSRSNLPLRLGLMFAVGLGAHLCQGELDGIEGAFWTKDLRAAFFSSLEALGLRDAFRAFAGANPLPDLFGHFYFLKFILAVIPGTIVGDLMLRWISESRSPEAAVAPPAAPGRLLGLSIFLALLTIPVFIGLQGRWPAPTLLLTVAASLGIVAVRLAPPRTSSNPTDRFLRGLLRWGAIWLLLGLLLDAVPYLAEGGIRKGPPISLSYPLVASGVTILLLAAFTVWIDVRGGMNGRLSWLLGTGQNPLLAYAAISLFLTPLLTWPWVPAGESAKGLNAMIDSWFMNLPWIVVLWAVLQCIVLAGLSTLATRRGLVWRT